MQSVPSRSRPIRAFAIAAASAALAATAPFALAAQPSVIPGATGFGMDTPAGRGGKVVVVRTLAAAGPGSLAAAVAEPGPRTVVFEVGGVIDLEGGRLEVSEPFLTIAGQTAPAPGITLVRGGLGLATHDVLVQHIRVRPGDAGHAKKAGWEPDGLSLYNPPGTPGSYRVVIDHCSMTWAVDENLSASGQRHEGREGTAHQVTFSHCLIAEALSDSSHAKGPHSMGTLIHDHCREVSIVGNLYACNVNRNPVLKPDASVAVVNNLIYNPGKNAIHSYWPLKEYAGQPVGPVPCELSVVGNVLWAGADSPASLALVQLAADQGRVYLHDNLALSATGAALPAHSGKPTILDKPPVWPAGLVARPAAETAEWVLARAGAWPAARDVVDQRIVEGVRARTGRIIDSQEQVGGYPKVEPTRHVLQLPAKPAADSDGDGYTDLEEWLHTRAAAVEGQPR